MWPTVHPQWRGSNVRKEHGGRGPVRIDAATGPRQKLFHFVSHGIHIADPEAIVERDQTAEGRQPVKKVGEAADFPPGFEVAELNADANLLVARQGAVNSGR